MVDYKRIKPKLSDLPIESSIKVFSFLKEVLEQHHLKLEAFQAGISTSTVGERYFIVYYSILYFDYYNTKSYLRKWIENKENSMVDYDEFSLQKHVIKFNSEQLVLYCKQSISSYKRRFIHVLINYPGINLFQDNSEFNKIDEISRFIIDGRKKIRRDNLTTYSQESIRIPITLKIRIDKVQKQMSILDSNLVIDSFRGVFSDLMSQVDFENLIKNTFRESASDNQFIPLRFLYIEFESKSILYQRIYDFYMFYTNEVKFNLQKQSKKEEEQIDSKLNRYESNLRHESKLPEDEVSKMKEQKNKELLDRAELANKFKFNFSNYTKYDFLGVFYFSFPVIRESYAKAQIKNTTLTISDYLRVESRNIKSRKKSN